MEWPCLQNVCSIIMHLAFFGGWWDFLGHFSKLKLQSHISIILYGCVLVFFYDWEQTEGLLWNRWQGQKYFLFHWKKEKNWKEMYFFQSFWPRCYLSVAQWNVSLPASYFVSSVFQNRTKQLLKEDVRGCSHFLTNTTLPIRPIISKQFGNHTSNSICWS